MPKNQYNIGTGGLILLAVVILGVAYFATGGFKSVGTTGPGTTYTPTGVSCPTAQPTGVLPQLVYLAGYQNQQNNNQNTSAAMAYNITTTPSSGYSLQTGATGTSYSNSTNLGLKCGGTYTLILAGGSDAVTGYYAQQITIGPIGANKTLVPFVAVQKMAQMLAPLVSNSTNFQVNATSTFGGVTPGALVTAGATYSNMQFTIRAGAGAYGGSGIIALLDANTVSVSSISLIGPGGASVPTTAAVYPSTFNVPSGFTVYAFQLPPLTTWSSTATYTVVVKTSSAFAQNTAIGLGLNDLPGFIENGALSFPQGGIDPNTHADIAEPITVLSPSAENTLNSGSGKPAFQLCKSAAGSSGCS